MLSRHWTTNREGYCLSDTCQNVPGTLEHLLIVCPALEHTRHHLHSLWCDKTINCPPLHQLLLKILGSPPNVQVKFILDSRAFPELIRLVQIYGQELQDRVMYLTRTFAFAIHRQKLKNLGRWPEYRTRHPARKLKIMNTYKAVGHNDDLNNDNDVTFPALTNDNIFPGSTRLLAAQPEQLQQGHGCQLTSTSTSPSTTMFNPANTMHMQKIHYDRPPVVPVLTTTNSDTQSANSDVRWDVDMCGSGQGNVVPVCGPGMDTGSQQPVSTIDSFFRAFLMSQHHSWTSWSLAWGSPP